MCDDEFDETVSAKRTSVVIFDMAFVSARWLIGRGEVYKMYNYTCACVLESSCVVLLCVSVSPLLFGRCSSYYMLLSLFVFFLLFNNTASVVAGVNVANDH